MCVATDTTMRNDHDRDAQSPPLEAVLEPPSFLARSSCLSVMIGCFAVWSKVTFVPEDEIPGVHVPFQHWSEPLCITLGYLVSLPLLWMFSTRFLLKAVNVKLLLRESMIVYNAGQVLLNGWMVYRIVDALLFRGHPFISGAVPLDGPIDLVNTGATYAVWVHYCDKYLEFFDTFFMVLRGKADQISFLHVYHHASIAWAWWLGMKLYPGGDIYFGALLNSWIHVMMYSYYTMSLLKIPCPWKKFLTQAQLLQFLSVVAYSIVSMAWQPQDASWEHYLAYSIQIFEMVSLFVLFMGFYRKAYSRKQQKQSYARDSATAATVSDSGSDIVSEQESISSQSSNER